MPLTAEQRRTRARNAADARHHPGADPGDLAARRLDQALDATDEAVREVVARAGAMTPEQSAKVGRLFTYIDPDASA